MFTKEMSILEALQAHPKARQIFKKFGMACLECMGAEADSIESGASTHGVDLTALMDELNKLDK